MKVNLNYHKYWGSGFNKSEEKSGFAKIMSMMYSEKKNIQDYTFLSKYSDEELGVWQDNTEDTLVIAFRGSKTAEDWLLTDLTIVIDIGLRQTPRFLRDKKKIELIMKDFPNFKIVFIGHSLGGTLAEEFYDIYNNSRDVQVFLYNRGTGPIEQFDENEEKDVKKKHFYSVGDPLSFFYLQDQGAIHKFSFPKILNTHGIRNFY
jgi:hypothetical protein